MSSRQKLANAIRFLAIDAVQKAKSGHPGMPMGMADIAEVLWNDFLHHNPTNPNWANRDRFILSNGHGSMLHYALLHLSGYDLTIEDLKAFRQLHSKTPGHPEFGETAGIETTTGPLGQGLAHGIGMALSEKILSAHFNRPNFSLIDHHTYVFLGDGCLMEGISHEAASLAGTLKLGKLIAFYDDNGISIDGHIASWFNEDVPKRFESYHWHVVSVDGHDANAIHNAIVEAQKITDKPSLICCKTTIGFGSPNLAGTEHCHGAPLGDAEIATTRAHLEWPHAPFEIPEDVYASWNAEDKGKQLENAWNTLFEDYKTTYPELANEWTRRQSKQLPTQWPQIVEDFIKKVSIDKATMATRKASQEALSAYAPSLPELFGGSADLTGSNNTDWKGCADFNVDQPLGNYLHYGVREFGMSAIMTGMALYGSLIPYGGTFLVFLDYARNAVRLASLMKQRVVFVYSHDSIGLGEDGPTHQPIEHITMLRATPNMHTWRPADTLETAIAWQMAIERLDGPSSLLLSRQNLPYISESTQAALIRQGGYVLLDNFEEQDPEIILIATGSEVHLAQEAARAMPNYRIRVVSMPCVEIFESQSQAYKDSVLPPQVTKRIAIEAGSTLPWYRYVGTLGHVFGIDQFGLSAPAAQVYQALNCTKEALIEKIKII